MPATFIHALSGLALFWAIVHVIAYSVKKPSSTVLPFSSVRPLRHSRKPTRLNLHKFILSIETSSYNTAHDALTRRITRSGLSKRLLKACYDVGIVVGVIGMLGAFALLGWTTIQYSTILAKSFHHFLVHDTPREGAIVERLSKRAAIPSSHTHDETSAALLAYDTTIQPIIPGLTVPLSHTPVILLSVLICQIIHELGHALSATLDQLPISSAGLSLTLILPSAFVSFPTTYLSSLPSKSKARITAAGPFHNFAFWCFLLLVSASGIGQVVQNLCGYRDISKVGRVVLNVDVDSPLYEHLPPGTLITALDDTTIGKDNTTTDNWIFYLNNEHQLPVEGWCIGTEFSDAPTSCCNSNNRKSDEHLACFVSAAWKGCLDPVPILTAPANNTRCSATTACSGEQTCVHPHSREHLLRITASQSREDPYVILWRGPREEVMEEVHVGTIFPSLSFLPIWLPSLVSLFYEYLETVTLSLFIFNLLPLTGLDGAKFLQYVTDWGEEGSGGSAEIYDVEALERRQSDIPGSSLILPKILRVIPILTPWMLGFCTIVAIGRLWVVH
ncbi:hypothetical protein AX16_000789 [Volvariella volvacea WC 439]|nr:hypothetical protein AX16_000789 [Volvariella volvacea WC 439]